jgi:hypothetical protein
MIPGVRVKRVVKSTIHVAPNGMAFVIPEHDPMCFWSFYHVWAYLAVWAGATLGALA